MNKKTIFKGLALINFVVLIGLFLLFKKGKFDHYLYKSSSSFAKKDTAIVFPKIAVDTSFKETDSAFLERLSSSKSIVIIDEFKAKYKIKQDNIDSAKIKKIIDEEEFLSSSKSALIFNPKKLKLDSFFNKKGNEKSIK
jgi:hypothetical protein